MRGPAGLAAALLLLVGACGCLGPLGGGAAPSTIRWHQQYEPVETPATLARAWEYYQAAARLGGPPAGPVRVLHLRRSVRKEHPARLARADVQDWQALGRRLTRGKAARVWQPHLSPAAEAALARAAAGEALTIAQELSVLRDLNERIRTGIGPPRPESARNRTETSRAGNGFRLPNPFRRDDGEAAELRARAALAAALEGVLLPVEVYRAPLQEGMELCETLDASRGEYVLYVMSAPGEPAFEAELAHEVFHLLQPRAYDWYLEGCCNLFSEKVVTESGGDWSVWAEAFAARRGEDPYAAAYFLARDLRQAAGAAVWELPRHVAPKEGYGAYRIDIDAWLATLPPPARRAARRAVRRHAETLETLPLGVNAFVPPRR